MDRFHEDDRNPIRTLLAAPGDDDAEFETSAGETAPTAPGSADSYSFDRLDLPQGMKVDAGGFGTAGEWCLKAGLNQGELNGVLASYSRALVDPDTATPEQQGLLQRARDTLLHHGPASDFRVLVRWPDYLGLAIDEALAPVALSSAYEETARRLRAIAREHVQGFATPGGVGWRDLGDALAPPEVAGLTGLLYLYNRFIAEITIAVVRLKQALSGDASAVENKFPVD